MVIEFVSIAIQGFRSFQHDQIFKFPAKPGFYAVTGENRVEPELGSNASGKSSVWDALCWVFYGQTSRGAKASAVGNWKNEYQTTVLCEFKRDGVLYNVMRAWNPNALSLTIAGEQPQTVTQEQVEAVIGLDYQAFLNTVLMSQFGSFFFDLSPTEKMAVFAQALSLDYWTEKSNDARQNVKQAEKERTVVNTDIATLSGGIAALGDRFERARERGAKFDCERNDRLAKVRTEYDDTQRRYDQYASEVAQITKEVTKSREDTQTNEQALIGVSRKHRELERRYDTLTADLKHAKRERDDAKTAIEQLKSNPNCPQCGQPITIMQAEKLSGTLGVTTDTVSELSEETERFRGQLQVFADNMRDLQTKLKTVESETTDAETRLRSASASKRAAAGECKHLQTQLDELESSVNPWTDEIETTRSEIRRSKAKLLGLNERVGELDKTIADHGFWATGFKDLRLWLIEEAILELQVHVNSSLTALGLHGWQVTFDVERDNSSGGVTRGFDAHIQSPHNPKRVPWRVWSGGETQRLRVAGAIGLMTLISNRLGVFFNLEVWDEPTAHLNESGTEQLLNFLSERSQSQFKQVWLVDHRSHAYGGFSGGLHVVKKKRGSELQVR